jgi:hypothetical protein
MGYFVRPFENQSKDRGFARFLIRVIRYFSLVAKITR